MEQIIGNNAVKQLEIIKIFVELYRGVMYNEKYIQKSTPLNH
jgi:hypothetical protein